jgi:CubicO group peptidase (beta-lactamase class C family)
VALTSNLTEEPTVRTTHHVRTLTLVLVSAAAFCLAPMLAQAPPTGAPARIAEGSVPPARFADPDRARRLAAAFPEIERRFTAWVTGQPMPGGAMGIVIDGELAWVAAAGVADLTSRRAVTPDTVFRIASMTKSFTAMAILALRDEGKLQLDDPVAAYVPELADLRYPTRDSPRLTIRHLLSHSEGFPEDNPWGDRQLARTDETLSAWLRQGIPFSNSPGLAYEYSNYGFAILGQVVQRVSKQPYAEFIRTRILAPLHMDASGFEASRIPLDRIAHGYLRRDGTWRPEPELPHGAFGSMGGLWTSARDLARYVAFHLSAYPPRDEAENGPVGRSSLREMQQAWRAGAATVRRPTLDASLALNVSAYGYGLGVGRDCRFGYLVSHGGGLPGYGSLMQWLPEYGVGIIALGNATYAGWGPLFREAFAALSRTGALRPRAVQPSPALLQAKADVSLLVAQWDDTLATRLAADNLFLDEPAASRRSAFAAIAKHQGSCKADPALEAENALRGTWTMTCERGRLDVSVTLAPTLPPLVQYLRVRPVLPPGAPMTTAIDVAVRLLNAWSPDAVNEIAAAGLDREHVRRQAEMAASQWGACRVGDTVDGDGSEASTVRLSCDRGALLLRLRVEPASRRITRFDVSAAIDGPCVQ